MGTTGAQFEKSGTATTTQTATDLLASWGGTDPHRYRVSWVTITNDSSDTNMRYRIDKSDGTQFTLGFGETFVHENCNSKGLWVDTASGTAAYRAWAQG